MLPVKTASTNRKLNQKLTLQEIIVRLERLKIELVRARRRGDYETAKILSWEKSVLIRKKRRFCQCGSMKYVRSNRCPDCYLKLYGRSHVKKKNL
jgi:hypothetical protein